MAPLLRLERVSLTFLRGRRHFVRVLSKVSLEVHAGETIAIFAPRAEGKSTLLRVAAGFDRPDAGKVLFEGEDLWRISDRRRSSVISAKIAFVQHRRPELDLPARELVALPLMRGHGRRRAHLLADEVLARAGIPECAMQRWDAMADRERVRLTLARGVACGPRLLLVDDLMNALDVMSETGRLLRTLADERKIAVMMSVPDMNATVWCDRVASLAGGELIVPERAVQGGQGSVIELFDGSRRHAAS